MKKFLLSLLVTFAVTACSDREDDQRGSPTDPMQQSEQADERDENASPSPEPGERDSAVDHSAQPAPSLETSDPDAIRSHEDEHAELQTYLNAYLRRTEADNIEQCSMFPYGHKACGGPETYVVYSQKDMSDETIAELENHVERYNQLDAFIKTTRGIVSTCDVTPEPEIRYENGRCVGDRSLGYR